MSFVSRQLSLRRLFLLFSDGPTYPEWVRHLAKPTYIDIVALLVENENGASIRVSVLNRHPSADWTGEVSLPGFKVQKAQVHSLYSEDLEAIVSPDACGWHGDCPWALTIICVTEHLRKP